jgi:hypothetical protein
MVLLLSSIAFKSLTGFVKKLWRQTQVYLCGFQIGMAQIHGKMMQKPLYIRAWLIPCCKTMNGERMTQVVNPWLLACVSSANAREIAQNSEILLEYMVVDRVTQPSRKKWGIGWPVFWPSAVILNQRLRQLRSYGNQSCLAEFRVPNRKDRLFQVHIRTSQFDCFMQSQACAIVHQDHGVYRREFQGCIPVSAR